MQSLDCDSFHCGVNTGLSGLAPRHSSRGGVRFKPQELVYGLDVRLCE